MTVAEIRHKGGLTHGVRVESGDGSVAYLPDHAPRRTDDALDALAEELCDVRCGGRAVELARQGETLVVGPAVGA